MTAGVATIDELALLDWKREIAYHQDPARTLHFALTELSRFAEVRHAYYPWEFTLAVYREARALPFAPT